VPDVIAFMFGVLTGTVRWLIGNPAAAGVLGVVAWLAFAYFSPYRECRWCRNRKKCQLGRWCLLHRPRCWRCHGHRRTRRLGAYHVHKVRQSIAQAWAERGDD
jgi:hypothetical protein